MAWKPGESGNPGGRGSPKPWQEALKAAMAQRSKGDYRKILIKIADSVVEAAMAGDKDAWREIGDRIDGKPAQTVNGNLDVSGRLIISD